MCQKDIYRRALEKRIFQKNDLKSNFFPCPLLFFFLFVRFVEGEETQSEILD